MKRLMHALPFLLLMATAVLFTTSCGKDGDTGPAGQQGEKGDKGDKGDKGETGNQGNEGTANVIYSDWLDVVYEADTVHLAGNVVDTVGYYGMIDAPKLTKAMLTSGELKIYINLSTAADPLITSMPYTGGNGVYIQYVAYENTIEFYSNIDAGTLQTNGGEKIQQYRYILIPGSTAARRTDAVDWNNYTAVKTYLGLKD